jgi:hypothetical protein
MSSVDDTHNRTTTARVHTVLREHFAAVVLEAHRSIQSGSELTGAPGQPVATGNLRNSWQFEFPTPDSARISTNVEYAQPIEDGIGRFGPLTLRSAVGGFHSVAMTVANFDRIIEDVRRRVPAAGS